MRDQPEDPPSPHSVFEQEIEDFYNENLLGTSDSESSEEEEPHYSEKSYDEDEIDQKLTRAEKEKFRNT